MAVDIDATRKLGEAAKLIDTDACHGVADSIDGVADDYPCVAAAQAMLRSIAEKAERFRDVRADVPALCARVRELEAALREAAHAVASAADVIEGLDGDMDDECKGAREDAGEWLKLAGVDP